MLDSIMIDDIKYKVVQKTNKELQNQECNSTIMFYGITDSVRSTIYINSEISKEEKKLTLVHEIIHAILHERGFDELNDEKWDTAVDGIAHGFRMAIKQNDLKEILK